MKIELCAASLESLRLAIKYNFDRVELCQALELGGLTPSHGFVQQALRFTSFQTNVLIRQRAGDFHYTSEELDCMLAEIYALNELKPQGFVIGAVNGNQQLHTDWLREAKKLAPDVQWTCHRVFDDLNDWHEGLEKLIELGFTRVLSSGLKSNVDEGLDTLCEMSSFARNRIEIMCGGGITQYNAHQIMQLVNPQGLHFSGTIEKEEKSTSLFKTKQMIVSEEKIAAILAAL